MTSDTTKHPSPLLFISHRHADQPIADVLRKFVTDRSGGRIAVFQSSSAQAENPRVAANCIRSSKRTSGRQALSSSCTRARRRTGPTACGSAASPPTRLARRPRSRYCNAVRNRPQSTATPSVLSRGRP
jgi:hypothetical protein